VDRRKGKQMPKPYHLDISVRNNKSKMKYNTLCKIIVGVLGPVFSLGEVYTTNRYNYWCGNTTHVL
jgi:hypothetical protein